MSPLPQMYANLRCHQGRAYDSAVAISKIALFYHFTPLADPEAIRLWQREICEHEGLRGRILISKDGINGTVGGEISAVKRYLRRTREHSALAKLDIKWSDGSGLDDTITRDAPHGYSLDFPRLSIKVRD